MGKLPLCRICLGVNAIGSGIINHELQGIYRELTGLSFKTEDQRPNIVCNYCKALLKKTLSLKLDCLAAEEVFSEILDSKKVPGKLGLSFKVKFVSFTLEPISIDSTCIEVVGNVADSSVVDTQQEVKIEIDPLSECETRGYLNPNNLESKTLKLERNKLIVLKDDSITLEIPMKVTHSAPFTQNIKMERTTEKKFSKNDHKSKKGPNTNSVSTKCNLQFKNISEIRENSTKSKTDSDCTREDSYKFQCPNCSRSFKCAYDAKRHILTHSNGRPFKCGHCDRQYKQSSTLVKHVQRVHPDVQNFDVTIIGQIFNTTDIKKTVKCKICQNVFDDKRDLSKHLQTHGKKPYECDNCQKCFKTRSLLSTHIRTAHSDEKPFQCDICQLAFKWPFQLKVHKYTHTGKKPFSCDLCGKEFAYKPVLIKHIRTHTGEKPYKCDQCWKSYSQITHLQQHRRSHTGEKPYQCQICFKSFARSCVFRDHLLLHSGHRPYKCEVCGKGFIQNHTKVVHMRTHTGEKPYPCNLCSKRFSSNGLLKIHKRVHTGDKPYQCDICQRYFSVCTAKKRHMDTVHRSATKQLADKGTGLA